MRDFEAHKNNLYALSEQEGTPGALEIPVVAEMLTLRDELIRDLKRVIEDDVRARLRERRAMGHGRNCRIEDDGDWACQCGKSTP